MVSTSLATGVANDTLGWLPSAGMGEEAVVVTTAFDTVLLYASLDGGHLFSHWQITNFTSSPDTSAFNSAGGTRIWNPGGIPGQVAMAVDGATFFLLYTTSIQGVVVAATMASDNAGLTWVGPYFTSTSTGAVADPVVAASPAGYFQTLWRDNSQGVWAQDVATYSADARPIAPPESVPGAGHLNNQMTLYPSAIAVDPFERPFFAWQGQQSGQLVVRYSGAFLGARNALNVLNAEFSQLQNWDYRAGQVNGANGSLQTLAANRIAWAKTNVTNYINHPTKTSYLCNLQNNTGNLIYPNVTHVQLQYASSSALCGNLGPGLRATNSSTSSGIPKLPPNYYWAPSVAMTLGPFAANSFLAVLCDWSLEAEGIAVSWSADPLRTLNPTGNVLPPVSDTVFSGSYTDPTFHKTATVEVNATPLNPTTGLLAVGPASFPTYSTNWTGSQIYCGKLGVWEAWQYTETASPYAYYSNVSVEGPGVHSFESGANLPSIYVANLTSNATAAWSGNFSAAYEGYVTATACGSHTNSDVVPPEEGLPARVTVPVQGSLTTSLRMFPSPPPIVNLPNKNYVNYFWNNTMPANATTELTNLSHTGGGSPNTWSNGTPERISEALQSSNLSVNDWYTAQLSATSQTGRYNRSLSPTIYVNQMSSAPPAATNYGCTFQFTTNSVRDFGLGITNYTAGNLTVQWNSSVNGNGWVRYYELGVGINFTQTAQEQGVGSPYEYIAELHGLTPSSWYEITGVTAEDSGCLTFEASNSTSFATFNNFPLHEQEYAYDSISHTGGGVLIWWNLPSNITRYANFVSGYLSYTNQSNLSQQVSMPIVAPLVPLLAWDSLYAMNVTGLGLNTSYSVTVVLNYTVIKNGQGATFQSRPYIFTYGLDSSGDGLTNWEKSYGWIVPVPNAYGGYWNQYVEPSITWVTANPLAWATNGLVNDFVEKEFDLDPNTIDTAGSHMLDTWNLTFDIGSSTSCPTQYFQCWNESSKTTGMNPFNFAQYPGGPHTGKANTTWTPPNKYPLDDGTQYDAYHLWSGTGTGNALSYLEGLTSSEGVGWLRAVIGYYPTNGHYTLTVWGKLSWGANPLAASTVFTGIPDGERVNPVYNESLEIASLSATESGLSNGNGFAVEFTVRNGTATSGTPELQNYSAPTIVSSTSKSISGYSVSIPVSQTFQNQTLQVEVIANEGGTDHALPFNGKHWEANVSLDMVNGAPITYAKTSGTGSPNATLSFTLEGAATGGKATTWLWLPTTNSTTNGLPLGLERYTGEQSFDLVVVNASGPWTSPVISYPANPSNTYTVSLNTGLNNLLIPREQFLNSSFGRGILLNATLPYTSASNPPLIVNGSDASLLTGFGERNLMADLSCYWQDRAVATGAGTINSATESGTANNTEGVVRVLGVTSASSSNTGGLATNPTLYSTIGAPPAVQSIITLNVSSQNELDLFLAGLLDNITGGLNGSFQQVTNQVPFFGFDSPVVSALANAALTTDGLYGPPPTTTPPSQTSRSSSLWGLFWNAATDVLALGKILVSLIEIAWNAAAAAFTYIDHLVNEAAKLGGSIAARAASALKTAGQALETGLNDLVGLVETGIDDLLRPVVQLIVNGVNAYVPPVNTSLTAAVTTYARSGVVTNQEEHNFYSALSGGLLPASTVVGFAVQIALSLISPLSLGAGFVVGIVLILLTVAITASHGSTPDGRGWSSAGAGLIQTFVSGLNGINAVFKNASFWGALKDLAVAGGVGGSLLAGFLWWETTGSADDSGLFAGGLLGLEILALSFTLWTFLSSSVYILLVALVFNLLVFGFTVVKLLATEEDDPLLWGALIGLSGFGAADALVDILAYP